MNLHYARSLKLYGMILFLVGLITGTMVMNFMNPRMALSSHLEGLLNGIFLLIVGVIWPNLNLSDNFKKMTYYALLYGTYANWFMTLLSAAFGTSKMTPLAGQGYAGSSFQEAFVAVGLVSLVLAMLFSLCMLIYGLRGVEKT